MDSWGCLRSGMRMERPWRLHLLSTRLGCSWGKERQSFAVSPLARLQPLAPFGSPPGPGWPHAPPSSPCPSSRAGGEMTPWKRSTVPQPQWRRAPPAACAWSCGWGSSGEVPPPPSSPGEGWDGAAPQQATPSLGNGQWAGCPEGRRSAPVLGRGARGAAAVSRARFSLLTASSWNRKHKGNMMDGKEGKPVDFFPGDQAN